MTILSLASFSAICGGGLFRETYRASNALNSTVKTETQLQEALDKIAYLENRELERRQMEVDRRRTTLEEASFNHSNNFSPSGSQHYSFDESHFEKLSPLSGDGSSFSEEEDLENLSVQSLPTIGSQHQQQNQRTHHFSATSLDLHLHAFEDGNEREFVAEVETLGRYRFLVGFGVIGKREMSWRCRGVDQGVHFQLLDARVERGTIRESDRLEISFKRRRRETLNDSFQFLLFFTYLKYLLFCKPREVLSSRGKDKPLRARASWVFLLRQGRKSFKTILPSIPFP